MKGQTFSFFVVMSVIADGPVWGQDADAALDEEVIGSEGGEIDCEELSEKIDIFVELQKAVNHDFATVTDPKLCGVMTEQCEHFFRAAKNLQREYRKGCDREYEIIEVAACDYDANPCYRLPANSPARAGVRRRGRVDYLSSVSGVYDVRSLSQ